MIKTQKQIHEDFLKTCAKVNGRKYLSESERMTPTEKREIMLQKLQGIKLDIANSIEQKKSAKHSFSDDNDDASKLIIKLKRLAEHVERVKAFSESIPQSKKFHI